MDNNGAVMGQQPVVSRPLVKVSDLYYRYPHADQPALSGVELSIERGDCFGLLGPNGAGKTTLISLLTGLLTLQRGSIEVNNYRYPQQTDAIKRCSALVPQEYAFYPSLTARENLQFFAGLYQVPKLQCQQRMDFCIEVCGLENVLNKRASSYSGGIKRRLNIALGLLHDPAVLYLDEPTVGIDAQSRHFILQSIENLKASGMTIIYTSHYMEEVEQLCDQVAIIDHGKLLLQQSMTSLLQGHRQLCVKPVVAPSDDQLALILTQPGVEWSGQQWLIETGQQRSVAQCMQLLEQQGIAIAQVKMGCNRLEDVYLAHTNAALRQ